MCLLVLIYTHSTGGHQCDKRGWEAAHSGTEAGREEGAA